MPCSYLSYHIPHPDDLRYLTVPLQALITMFADGTESKSAQVGDVSNETMQDAAEPLQIEWLTKVSYIKLPVWK